MKIIVTGGAGFIGSNLIRHLIAHTNHIILNIDKLTYAANSESLSDTHSDKYTFMQADIGDYAQMTKAFETFQPDAIMNLAAESHVDRSIDGPALFMQTNILGTFNLLECARAYHVQKKGFIFHHISTDEVFGSLGETGFFTETTPYAPNSPYSASKASSDHLVRAWHHTYGLKTLITNCSNNYGPYQVPEKLIPLIILNALEGKDLPVYGNGQNVRDWLYVEDHARALLQVLEKGKPGETYNVGGNSEKKNIDIVREICKILDDIHPKTDGSSYASQIQFVKDRPGHDQRYAIDYSKIKNELEWEPKETFETGLLKTVMWYADCYQQQKSQFLGETFRNRVGL